MGRYTWSPGASRAERNRARLKHAQMMLVGAPPRGERPRPAPKPRPDRPQFRPVKRPARPALDVEAGQASVRETVDRVVTPAGVDPDLWQVRHGMTGPYVVVRHPDGSRSLSVRRDGDGWAWSEDVDEPDRYGVPQVVSRGGGRVDDDTAMVAVVRDFVSGGTRAARGGDRFVREADVIALLRDWGYLPSHQRSVVDPDAARALLYAFDGLSDEEHAVVWALDNFERAMSVGFTRGRPSRLLKLAGSQLSEFNAKHPRDRTGKFRTVAARVMGALAAWQERGDREADPFEGFGRDQLRKVAKARGVAIRRGADRDEISKALLDDLERKELRPRAEGVDARAHETMVTLAGGEKATIGPDGVDPLMRAMTAMASGAKKDARAGEAAPTFNLANLQIEGEGNGNLFRRHLRDRPRETMPQLPTGFGEEGKTSQGRTMEEFEDYLRESGVEFEYGWMDPRELVASQSELSGPKVAKLYGFMRDGGWLETGVMIIARSGDEWAVVDGHHRWAGAAAASIARGGTLDVRVLKIDAEIDDVLGTPESPEGIVMGFASFEGLAADREA